MKNKILISAAIFCAVMVFARPGFSQEQRAFDQNVRSSEATATPLDFYFMEHDSYATGLVNFMESATAFGDYDNDGCLDILIAGQGYENGGWQHLSKIYHNNGNGTFTDINAPLIGVKFSAVAWGDYDNDGDLDVVLCGEAQDDTKVCKVYENQGEGVFAENPDAVLPGVFNGAVAWGDYDNDGKLDILLSGDTGGFTGFSEIYRNNGDGTFTPIDAGLIGFSDASAAFGDYNNDGKLDVLLSGISGDAGVCSKVYRNNGNGTFTSVGGSMPGAAYGSAAWGDYDNDGDLDFLVTGTSVYIMRNYGNDTFFPTGSTYFPSPLAYSHAAWGDCNNDGKLDIVLTGDIGQGMPERISRVYLNMYPAGFVMLTQLIGASNGSAAWGDYNNDEKLDILQTGSLEIGETDNTVLYENIFADPNTPPETPADLKAVTGIKKVTLRWGKSSDAQTPQSGLTYNLYVGTTQESVNVLSPMADISSGWRKVAALGSQNENTSWVIKDLPVGKYFWGVQALDTAFAGSAFATGSFTVRPDIGPPGPGPLPLPK